MTLEQTSIFLYQKVNQKDKSETDASEAETISKEWLLNLQDAAKLNEFRKIMTNDTCGVNYLVNVSRFTILVCSTVLKLCLKKKIKIGIL